MFLTSILHAATAPATPALDLLEWEYGISAVVTGLLTFFLIATVVISIIERYTYDHSTDENRPNAYDEVSSIRTARMAFLGGLAVSTLLLALFYTTKYQQDLADAPARGCYQTDTYADGTTVNQCSWAWDPNYTSSTDTFWLVIAWMAFVAALILAIVQLSARPWKDYSETPDGIEDSYEQQLRELRAQHQVDREKAIAEATAAATERATADAETGSDAEPGDADKPSGHLSEG